VFINIIIIIVVVVVVKNCPQYYRSQGIKPC